MLLLLPAMARARAAGLPRARHHVRMRHPPDHAGRRQRGPSDAVRALQPSATSSILVRGSPTINARSMVPLAPNFSGSKADARNRASRSTLGRIQLALIQLQFLVCSRDSWVVQCVNLGCGPYFNSLAVLVAACTASINRWCILVCVYGMRRSKTGCRPAITS
jgi:hypothetical protein